MTDTPQPGTPLPWTVLSEDATGFIAHVSESGFATLVASMESQEQDAEYLVYAANELPKREARIERLLQTLTNVSVCSGDHCIRCRKSISSLFAEIESAHA